VETNLTAELADLLTPGLYNRVATRIEQNDSGAGLDLTATGQERKPRKPTNTELADQTTPSLVLAK
jgi:hypothetical protein